MTPVLSRGGYRVDPEPDVRTEPNRYESVCNGLYRALNRHDEYFIAEVM